jgi:hypothetical protein
MVGKTFVCVGAATGKSEGHQLHKLKIPTLMDIVNIVFE